VARAFDRGLQKALGPTRHSHNHPSPAKNAFYSRILSNNTLLKPDLNHTQFRNRTATPSTSHYRDHISMPYSCSSSFTTMASIRTTASESNECAGIDPFGDFDGAYSIHDDEPGEPSYTSSQYNNGDNAGSQRLDTDSTATREGTRKQSSRLRRARGWVRRLLRCL
jgi:hypothetical protein